MRITRPRIKVYRVSQALRLAISPLFFLFSFLLSLSLSFFFWSLHPKLSIYSPPTRCSACPIRKRTSHTGTYIASARVHHRQSALRTDSTDKTGRRADGQGGRRAFTVTVLNAHLWAGCQERECFSAFHNPPQLEAEKNTRTHCMIA